MGAGLGTGCARVRIFGGVFGVNGVCLWAMGWFWGLFEGLKGHGTKAVPQSGCPPPCLSSGVEGGLGVQHAAGAGAPSG